MKFIEVKNVNFSYEIDSDEVLNDFSIDIEKGLFVAILGHNGSGKSTTINCILSLLNYSDGSIKIFGKEMQPNCYDIKSKIGVVFQDVAVFDELTVYENINYGNTNATKEEIIDAARRANANFFIENLPNGYHTEIGQRGVRLSGGQKQRLSIARVFIKNPPILIFDEATSALDNETQSEIQNAIENLKGEYTILIVAHRLSTVIDCDKIYVVDLPGYGFAKVPQAEKDRWSRLMPELEKIPDFIDEQALILDKAVKRNFQRWNIWDWVDWVKMPSLGSYEKEVAYLKEFYSDRLEWLDRELNKL